MTKELTPLEAFENLMKNYYEMCLDTGNNDEEYQRNNLTSEYHVIEKALKDKEQQDSILKVLKEVIQFGVKMPEIKPNKDNGFDIMSAVGIQIQREIENEERKQLRDWILKTCFPKELIALEIIKRTGLSVDWFVSSFIKQDADYNVFLMLLEEMGDKGHLAKQLMMTQEEFDLLKEVLK